MVPYGPWFDAGLTLLFPNGLVRSGICAGDGSVVCKLLGPLGCRVTFYRGPKCMGTYLYEDPVDCRNNIRGLATVVDHELDHWPLATGSILVLIARPTLSNVTTGRIMPFIQHCKCLGEDVFRWLRSGEKLSSLTGQQINQFAA